MHVCFCFCSFNSILFLDWLLILLNSSIILIFLKETLSLFSRYFLIEPWEKDVSLLHVNSECWLLSLFDLKHSYSGNESKKECDEEGWVECPISWSLCLSARNEVNTPPEQSFAEIIWMSWDSEEACVKDSFWISFWVVSISLELSIRDNFHEETDDKACDSKYFPKRNLIILLTIFHHMKCRCIYDHWKETLHSEDVEVGTEEPSWCWSVSPPFLDDLISIVFSLMS